MSPHCLIKIIFIYQYYNNIYTDTDQDKHINNNSEAKEIKTRGKKTNFFHLPW